MSVTPSFTCESPRSLTIRVSSAAESICVFKLNATPVCRWTRNTLTGKNGFSSYNNTAIKRRAFAFFRALNVCRMSKMIQANQLALELSEKVVQFCLEHDLAPGDRLAERKLAAAFGVSRSPIRAALKVLEDRSVVRRTDRAYVLALSPSELTGLSLDVPPAAAEELYVQVLRDRFAGRIPEQISEADLLREYKVTR